jgi:hypothetical protein
VHLTSVSSSFFMAFTAPLTALRDLARDARLDAAHALGAGSQPTVDLTFTKEQLSDRFKGAVFQLHDGTLRFAAAPFAKAGGGAIELVLSGHGIGTARRFAKMAWCDSNESGIRTVMFNILDPHRVHVGGRISSFTPCRAAGEEAAFAAVSITTGTSPPYSLPFEQAVAIATTKAVGEAGACRPEFETWVPQHRKIGVGTFKSPE